MEHGDERQDRGTREAYERYLAGMDASMRQKVALTAAHLLGVGHVADMGMGSGAGSHALARLHPALRVVGVDLDPAMVSLARERYVAENLSFVVGDIAGFRVVPLAGPVQGALDDARCRQLCQMNDAQSVSCALTDEPVTYPAKDSVVRCEGVDASGTPAIARIAAARRHLPEGGTFSAQLCTLWCTDVGIRAERCVVEVLGAPERPPPNLRCTVTSEPSCSG